MRCQCKLYNKHAYPWFGDTPLSTQRVFEMKFLFESQGLLRQGGKLECWELSHGCLESLEKFELDLARAGGAKGPGNYRDQSAHWQANKENRAISPPNVFVSSGPRLRQWFGHYEHPHN